MTLPPCPIPGHDDPHHWHDALYPGVEQVCRPPHNYSNTDSGCLEDDPDVSRCYSAHVPESTEPAPLLVLPTVDEIADAIHGEWALDSLADRHRTYAVAVLALLESRVPHWAWIEPGTAVKAGTHLLLSKPSGEHACVIAAKDSELHADPKGGTWYVDPRTIPAEPAPTPAEKLAEALTDRGKETWCADVLAALDDAGLTLAERGER